MSRERLQPGRGFSEEGTGEAATREQPAGDYYRAAQRGLTATLSVAV